MTISRTMEKVLVDLTGQPQPETAFQSAIRDILEHRLEKVDIGIRRYERKYKNSFLEFKKAWDENRLADKHGYEIEKDYWEWEALYSRKTKLQEISKWVM